MSLLDLLRLWYSELRLLIYIDDKAHVAFRHSVLQPRRARRSLRRNDFSPWWAGGLVSSSLLLFNADGH